MSTAEPKSDPLRLSRCIRCGYSLTNLPDEGACPECGLAYDQDMIVFYGVGCTVNLLFNPAGTWWSVLACVGYAVLQVNFGWDHFRRGEHWDGIIQAGSSTVVVGIMLAWRLLARRASGGNLLQCRFNSFGCLQCPLPEETTGLTDPHRFAFGFWLAVLLVFFLGEITRLPKPWPLVALPFGVVVAASLWWWASWMSKRRLNLQLPKPPAAEALAVAAGDAPHSGPTPWVGAQGISIQPVKSRPGRYRLIFGIAIDAEVDCTGEQATALWNRVCAWRAAAGVPIHDEMERARGFPVLPARRVGR